MCHTRIHLASVATFILAAAGLLACSSSDDGSEPGPGTPDAATSDAGTTPDAADRMDGSNTGDAADEAAACTPVANIGGVVNKTQVAGSPPGMTGGTIVDGTYALTKFELYNGQTGDSSYRETLVFAGGNGQNVSTTSEGDKVTFFTYATNGNQLTLTAACGGSGSFTTTYTATPTTFTLVSPGNPNQVQTFEKQQ